MRAIYAVRTNGGAIGGGQQSTFGDLPDTAAAWVKSGDTEASHMTVTSTVATDADTDEIIVETIGDGRSVRDPTTTAFVRDTAPLWFNIAARRVSTNTETGMVVCQWKGQR